MVGRMITTAWLDIVFRKAAPVSVMTRAIERAFDMGSEEVVRSIGEPMAFSGSSSCLEGSIWEFAYLESCE